MAAAQPASPAVRADGVQVRGALVRLWRLLPWVACFAASASVHAQDARPLFQADDALAVTLEAPWSQVLRKTRQPHAHPAVLGYTDAQGRPRRIEATVETRGITRLRVCQFPPVRIRFAPGAAKDTLFEGQRSLKMVTHCQARKRHEDYYVKELLAYRIYNLLTELSFRVRPLDVTYLDIGGGKPNGPRFAFLIEDLRDVARRGGHKVAGEATFAPTDFDARALTRFMLFQYLLGNTDWDVTVGPRSDACCHNVRVLGGRDPRTRFAVPYDFDAAGLVDTSYAAPAPELPINYVTERLYRGFCVHNDALEPARQEFLGHRAAIHALVRNESRLDPQAQRAAAAYIEGFYAVLGNDAAFARQVRGKCRR